MTTQTSKLKVEIETTGERTKVRGLTNELKDLKTAGAAATNQTAALSKSIKIAGGAFAGLAGGIGISQVVQDIAQLQDINSRIGALTGDLASSQQFLKTTAAELSAEYVTLAGGYSQLLPLYEAQIVSLKQVQDLTVGLANVQAKAGASNEALKLSMNGLSQALSAGNVNYEDYKQIVEPLPGLNAKIAASFGLTSGELKELISTGQLTSEEFGVKAVEALKKYDGAAAALAGNLTQTFNRTKNAYTEVIAAFSEPVGGAATEGAQALADTLELVADNADTITAAVTAAGVATGVAFTGQASASIATYVARQYEAVKGVFALRAATVASTKAAVADADVKLIQAANTQAIAAADLKAAQAKAASITGFKRLTFVAGELAVAERAVATATTQLAAAQTAATASAGKLVAAQKAATLAGAAMATATRASSAALALVGGPAGAITIAAGAIAYFALKQSETSQTIEAGVDVLSKLEGGYYETGEAALAAAAKQEQSSIEALKALREQLSEIASYRDKYGDFIGGLITPLETDDIERDIATLTKQIDEATRSAESFADTMRRASEYDAQFDGALEAFDLIGAKAKTAREILDKLVPDDAKKQQLKDFAAELEVALTIGAISQADYNKGTAAIDAQIAKMGANRESTLGAAEAARELQAALDAAIPEQARVDEFNAQVDALDAGLKRGAITATQYTLAMAGLQDEFDRPALEEAKEKADKLNEALGNRISTSYGDYADEVRMLNDALIEATGNADLQSKINLALANIDAEIRADLTIVEGDTQAKVQESLDRQRKALDEFHAERQVSASAAQADLDALNQDAARKQEDIAKQVRDRLADLSGASEAITIEFDYADTTSELDRMLEDGKINIVQYHDAVEAAYKDHQERLRDIVRSGEASQSQVQGAFLNDRVAGIAAKYEDELAVAKDFANALVDTRINKETREASAAQSVAQQDAAAAAEALEAYKKNGTEENKIAYENAKKKAAISEAAAKVQFEQQKQASIAGAKLSAGLAVANALATSPWYVGLAQAAIAIYKTNDIIAGIKSQTYASPSAASYGSSSGSTTGATFGSNTPTTGGGGSTVSAATTERLVVFVGDFRSEEEAMFEVGRQQRRLFEEGYINSTPDGLDFGNVPDRTIRLS